MSIFREVSPVFKTLRDEARVGAVEPVQVTNDEHAAVSLVKVQAAAAHLARLTPWWRRADALALLWDIRRDCRAIDKFLYSKTPAMGTHTWPEDPLT